MLILRYYLLVIGDPNLNGCPDFSQCNSPATKPELVTYTSLWPKHAIETARRERGVIGLVVSGLFSPPVQRKHGDIHGGGGVRWKHPTSPVTRKESEGGWVAFQRLPLGSLFCQLGSTFWRHHSIPKECHQVGGKAVKYESVGNIANFSHDKACHLHRTLNLHSSQDKFSARIALLKEKPTAPVKSTPWSRKSREILLCTLF